MAAIPGTDVQDKPQSTVSQPTASPLSADAQKRLQETISRVGYAPRTQEENDMFNRMTFTADELSQMGLDKSYQDLSKQTDAARMSLSATPAPTQTGLNVLQDALNAKSNVRNQALGESELFKQAGLSGYTVLRESIAERSREMNTKYESFANVVKSTAGAMVDTYNLALDRYSLLRDELDKQDQKMYSLLDEALEYERMMDKMYQEQQFDLEMKRLQQEYSNKYGDTASNYETAKGSTTPATAEEMSYAKGGLTDIFGLGEAKGWCGVWASELSTATKVGDSWASKKSHIDKTSNPKPGDKLLVPLGVSDGKGYGHVATVIGYNSATGDVLVVESNRDGRQNKGNGLGIATLGVYNMQDMQQTYGNNFGFASGNLKPQYQGAIELGAQYLGLNSGMSQAQFYGENPDLYTPQLPQYTETVQQATSQLPGNIEDIYSAAFKNKADESNLSEMARKQALATYQRMMQQGGNASEPSLMDVLKSL